MTNMMLRDATGCSNGAAAVSRTPARPTERAKALTKPKAGDWVTVKSKEAILSTLDANGRLDGLPFMPQMFK